MTAKRVRNEKLHAVLHYLRLRAKKDHDDVLADQTRWAIWDTCADMIQTVMNASAEELDARPVTVALPKFRPGQSVWVVKRVNVNKQCPCCHGSGQITGVDMEGYTCGNCHGDGHVYDCIKHVPCQLAVHKVGMFLTSGGACEVETLYTLERGNGNWDPIGECRLHATEAECLATCARMNAGEWGRAI